MDFSLQRDGFVIAEEVLDTATVGELSRAVDELPRHHRSGARNLLTDSAVLAEMARAVPVKRLADEVLGVGSFPVRALLFDKTTDANWMVPWHQDTAVAVTERVEVPGFIGWSVKDGVPHVHPPAAILERMATLRIHLDDCGPDSGPLKVIPGSHRDGRLSRERIEWWKTHGEVVECHVPACGALLMRPLLLHSSSPARKPSHRRVLHLEFAAERLPGGLHWAAESAFGGTENLSLLTSAATNH